MKKAFDSGALGDTLPEGFRQILESDIWKQREDKSRAQDLPTLNCIFERG